MATQSRPAATRYDTASGVQLYRISVHVFPHMLGNAYLVFADGYSALIDCGSGLGTSDEELDAGVRAVAAERGERVWETLDRIVVTHGHIDHHGGLNFVRRHSDAPIAIHELDRRILTGYEERQVMARRALAAYLTFAGVAAAEMDELLALYGWSKTAFSSLPVQTTLRHGDRLDGLFDVLHTPGHCPGQVCLRVDDILLSADHVLPQTSLFLSPERIASWNGMDHYLASLDQIAGLGGIRLALGGHGAPMDDFAGWVAKLRDAQQTRIAQALAACAAQRSVADVARLVYPELRGYDWLLAIQKAGACVEYLDNRGELAVANLDAVASQGAAPLFVAL